MTTINVLEALASIFGAVGALLLAFNGRYAGWGFVSFLVSNGFCVAFSRQSGHWFLLAQQLVFTVTSLIGVWRWLVQPRLVELQTIFDHIASEGRKK